jgi:hypothetical protein
MISVLNRFIEGKEKKISFQLYKYMTMELNIEKVFMYKIKFMYMHVICLGPDLPEHNSECLLS